MYCPKCGSENESEAKFCAKCGMKLEEDENMEDDENVIVSEEGNQEEASLAKDQNFKHKKLIIAIVLVLVMALSVCAAIVGKHVHKSNQWQKYYDSGQNYLTLLSYEDAITEFTNAIQIDERKPEAYIGRGDAYCGSAYEAEAAEEFETAIEFYDKAVDDYETAEKLEENSTAEKIGAVKLNVENVNVKIEEKQKEEEAKQFFEAHKDEAEKAIQLVVNPRFEFNCETFDKGELIDMLIGPDGLCSTDLEDYYDLGDIYEEYVAQTPDPLGKILWGHDTCYADKIDWIISNILNMTPDHSATYTYGTGEWEEMAYYYNDRYYMPHEGWGGDTSLLMSVKIDEYQSLGDDIYLVKYSSEVDEMTYDSSQISSEVKIKGKTINGKFYWTFLSWSKAK